jgi:endo-1,3-1,4-beta-glycanase ExoK
MRSKWTLRLAAGLALAAAGAGWLAIDSLDSQTGMTASAEPAPAAKKNTGSPPGGAFLMDLRKAVDPSTRYLAEYEMDEEWIKIAYRQRNIRFDPDGMTLTLAKVPGKLPFSGSEFQRNGTYGYGRYEVVMKASEASGAVSSFFTYTGPHFGDPHDEIDFEFLGRTPRLVHLTYFNNGDNHQVEIPLWFDTAMGDHLYAFEWMPDSIRWYVDGVKVYEVSAKTAKLKLPTTTGRVMVNLWAGAGPTTGWTGEAEFTRTTASYRCISHVPLGKTAPQCSDTFKPPPKPKS